MSDETIIVNPAGLADLASGHRSFAQELDSLGQEAMQAVQGSHDYFQGPQGAAAYNQVMNLIHQAVNDRQQVINAHGNAIDTSAENGVSTDAHVGQGFASI